jgi:hypothetical protein
MFEPQQHARFVHNDDLELKSILLTSNDEHFGSQFGSQNEKLTSKIDFQMDFFCICACNIVCLRDILLYY